MKRLLLVMIMNILFFSIIFYSNQYSSIANEEPILTDINLSSPSFSHEGGFYELQFYLEIATETNGTIYYTLDGSYPTKNASVYQDPILIEKQMIQATGQEYIIQNDGTGQVVDLDPTVPLSMIRSSASDWKSPLSDIFKATVVKAIVIDDNGLESKVNTQTYFVDEDIYNKYSFPIVSLSTDAKNLFSYETGINVPGINYDPLQSHSELGNRTGNYYEEGDLWEREVFLEYFSSDGQLNLKQDAGIRIHGGLSRNYPIKSYRLYARDEYGESKFNYRFFEDKETDVFKRLILRAGGQTYEYTFMGEAAAQSLLKPLDLDIQYNQPVILFINGEYFGIRNIRDRFDDWYLSTTYDINKDDITILTGNAFYQDGKASGSAHYQFLYDFVTEKNMSKDLNYRFVESQMDIENFVDYYIAELYYANEDWPQNNILYWRSDVRYHPNAEIGKDGRWRWMIYDIDGGFAASRIDNTAYSNPFDKLTGETWKTGKMFTSLLKNENFKNYFINRYADLMNTVFEPSRVLKIVNEMEALYAPEMTEHIQRWGYPITMSKWESYVDKMEVFASDRPVYALDQLKDYLDLGQTSQLIVKKNHLEGTIRVNSLVLNGPLDESDDRDRWEGTYFTNTNITLSAIPSDGYKFKGWYDSFGNLVSININLETQIIGNETFEALFEIGTTPEIHSSDFLALHGPWLLIIFGMSTLTALIYFGQNNKKVFKNS